MFKRTTSLVALSVMSVISQAQEAGRIEAGQFDIIPTFNTSMSYVDNVAYARDGEPKIYSWRATFSPEIIAATEIDGNPIQFGYRLDRGVYFSSSADDYTDHFFEASGEYELNSRHRLSGTAQYEDGHDERGTGFSIGLGDDLLSPDTYKSSYLGTIYSYGVATSDASLSFRANRETLDYDKNETAYLIRNRAESLLGTELGYKIGPSTTAIIDISLGYVRYDQDLLENSLDSDETRVLLGLRWESTAATTGFAKIGYKEKVFESEARSTFYGTDWEVGVEWQPVSYSTFNFSTSADTNETNGEGNFIRGRYYTAIWSHTWIPRLSTNFRVIKESNEYVLGDPDVENRDDDIMRYVASLNYEARRWLNFSLFYDVKDRDSNRELIGYDRNVVGISAEITL